MPVRELYGNSCLLKFQPILLFTATITWSLSSHTHWDLKTLIYCSSLCRKRNVTEIQIAMMSQQNFKSHLVLQVINSYSILTSYWRQANLFSTFPEFS